MFSRKLALPIKSIDDLRDFNARACRPYVRYVNVLDLAHESRSPACYDSIMPISVGQSIRPVDERFISRQYTFNIANDL